MNNETIQDLLNSPLEAQTLLKTSLKLFIKVFHYYLTKQDFIFKQFHNEIIEALEERVYGRKETKNETKNNNSNLTVNYPLSTVNLCINLPPRFGKSQMIIYFIAWTYAINKDCNNIYTSYSDTLALKFSSEIKQIVESELYSELFNLRIKTDSKSKEIWKIDNGGETRGVSLGGAITGFGAGTITDGYGGALIIDDPLKVEEANSKIYLNKCIRYYEDTLKSRLNNKNTPIILIMQRINKNDLVNHIKRNEYNQWDFVTIPLIDKNNVIAWEEKYSREAIEDMKQKNPYKFYSQYQQEPQEDETHNPFIKVEVVDYFDKIGCIAWLDPSSKGKDYTALCLIKRNFSNLIALGFMWKRSWDECVEQIAEVSNTFNIRKIIAETN